MKGYQLRVIQEFEDLVQRRAKLISFLKTRYQEISDIEECALMDDQVEVMTKYALILAGRIQRWRTNDIQIVAVD